MGKFQPIKHIKKAFQKVYDRASSYVKSFSKQTDVALSEEPIDFSAPSIPYYENLANRLSFVRIVIYMVLFVFIVGTVISNHKLITYENLYYLAKDIGAATLTAQSRADQISYPISSSQPGGQATNLQGIWNEDAVAPWNSNYTININSFIKFNCLLGCIVSGKSISNENY